MVKKVLLGLGLTAVACMASAQTPVFQEGFDAAQTKQPTDLGYYEFINSQEGDTRDIVTDGAYAGAGCLQFVNSQDFLCENQGWQRAIKFRNLPLQDGKIYQINFALKGSNTYVSGDNTPKCSMRLGLMQGYENSDISILGANGQDQTYTIQDFDEESYVKYSRSFYFASKENQDAQYKSQGKDEAYINSYFTTFNIINPGTFYLDEVELVEVANAVDNIVYGGDVIRVKYMFDTNIASLAKAEELGRVILDPSCASVKIGTNATKVETVELHQDGYLYIFLEEMYFDSEALDGVFVSFTNPDNIINFSGTADNAKLFAFEAVKASNYDEEVSNVSSFAYEEALMVSSDPANNSFTLDETISEFSLTFDHNIYTGENDFSNAPTATLSNGETLQIKEGQEELSKSIIFVRTSNALLTKGAYKLTVSGITTEKGTTCTTDQVISFETGKIKMAETVYTDVFTKLLTGANGGQPDGWTILIGGADFAGGEPKEDNGVACRNINLHKDGVEYTAFYLCDRDGYTYMKYGDKEGYSLTIPAGNISFSVLAVGHESATRRVEYVIEDMEGTVLATCNEMTDVLAADNFSKMSEVNVKFVNDVEKNVIIKIHEPEGGFTACRIMGLKCQTYVETPGDKYEPEVILESKFKDANMPAEGTGWLFYENNNQLTPGSGRSGTSGMLSNNFHAKMQIAAFFRECGANENAAMRIEYGNGNGVESGFEIKTEGGYEITYYAGTWNDAAGNAAGTSKVFMQLINVETGEVAFYSEHVNIANFNNGSNCVGQADKVTEELNLKAGKYYLKAWGTTNTVWGSFSLVKPGSIAAKYYALIMEAVELAKAELALCENEKYNGSTKSELTEFAGKCSDPSFMHTEAEFIAAIENLNALTDAMAARRKNIDAYEGNLNTLANSLASAEGTKFEKLDVYPKAVECYNLYKDVNPTNLDDATLAAAVADMGNMGQLLGNMTGTCVNLLTKQIVELAAMIVALDSETESHPYVLAAGEAISDDQALVSNLKKLYAAKLYKKIDSDNPFIEYNEEYEQEIEKTIEAGAMIQNREFYSTAQVPAGASNVYAQVTDFPGWTIEIAQGVITPIFTNAWDGPYATAVKPIENCAVKSDWGTREYDVKQVINNLPVGKYVASIVIGEDGGDPHGSYAYCGEGDAKVISEYVGVVNPESGATSYSRDNTVPQEFADVVTVINDNLGEITLGAHIMVTGGFGKVDNANLVMVGPVEGFNYGAAAAAIEEEISTSVESISAEELGEPVMVEYYNLNGIRIATPESGAVAIEIAHFNGGYMKVSKVIVE